MLAAGHVFVSQSELVLKDFDGVTRDETFYLLKSVPRVAWPAALIRPTTRTHFVKEFLVSCCRLSPLKSDTCLDVNPLLIEVIAQGIKDEVEVAVPSVDHVLEGSVLPFNS